MTPSSARIASIEFEIHIPSAQSLKDKRRVIRSLKDRLRANFNISVAETDHQDKWQRATLSIVSVSTDALYLEGLFESIARFIENEILGSAYIIRQSTEIH